MTHCDPHLHTPLKPLPERALRDGIRGAAGYELARSFIVPDSGHSTGQLPVGFGIGQEHIMVRRLLMVLLGLLMVLPRLLMVLLTLLMR